MIVNLGHKTLVGQSEQLFMSAVGSAKVDSRTNGKFPLYLHELAQRH